MCCQWLGITYNFQIWWMPILPSNEQFLSSLCIVLWWSLERLPTDQMSMQPCAWQSQTISRLVLACCPTSGGLLTNKTTKKLILAGNQDTRTCLVLRWVLLPDGETIQAIRLEQILKRGGWGWWGVRQVVFSTILLGLDTNKMLRIRDRKYLGC